MWEIPLPTVLAHLQALEAEESSPLLAYGTVSCPEEALKVYLRTRKDTPVPLFLHDGTALTGAQVNHVLRKPLQLLGHKPEHYSSYSLRVGRATDLAYQGTPDDIIKKTGRWHSSAYLKCLRFDAFQLPATPQSRSDFLLALKRLGESS